jgi:hypothetical protein
MFTATVSAIAVSSTQIPFNIGVFNNTVNLNNTLYLSHPFTHIASNYSVNVFVNNDSIIQTTRSGINNYSLSLNYQNTLNTQTQILNSMFFNGSLYISTTSGLLVINQSGQTQTLDSLNTNFSNLNYVLSTSNDGLNVYVNTLSGIDDLQNNQTYLEGFNIFNSIIENNIIYAATNKGLISFNLNTNVAEVLSNTPTLNIQDYKGLLTASTNNGVQFFNTTLASIDSENSCFKTVFGSFLVQNSLFAATPQGVISFNNNCNVLDSNYSTSAYYSPDLNLGVFGTVNGFDVINFTPISGSFTSNIIGQNYPVVWSNYTSNSTGVVQVLARFENYTSSWTPWENFTPTEADYAQFQIQLQPSNTTTSISELNVNYLEITPPSLNITIQPETTNSNVTISIQSNKPVQNASAVMMQKNATTIIQLNKTSNYTLSGEYNVLKGLDGNATVEVQAWDYYQNEGVENASFIVDTTPPSVEATLNQSFYTSNSMASGIITPSETATIYFNSPQIEPSTIYFNSSLNNANNSFTLYIPQTLDGYYKINLTAVDDLGNVNNTFIAIPVHNPPTINAVLSNNTVPENFNVALKVNIVDSAPTTTEILFNNTLIPINNSYTFKANPGNYSFIINTTDSYNLSSNATMNFTVLNQNATLKFNYACNGSSVELNGNVTFENQYYPNKLFIPQTNTLIKNNGVFNTTITPSTNTINVSVLNSNINQQVYLPCLQTAKTVAAVTPISISKNKTQTPIQSQTSSGGPTINLPLLAGVLALAAVVYAVFKLSDKKTIYDLKYFLKDKKRKFKK